MGLAVVYLTERNHDAVALERRILIKGRLFAAANEKDKAAEREQAGCMPYCEAMVTSHRNAGGDP